MQLRAYLIRNRAPHVINSHVHLAVAILSGKKKCGEAVLRVAHGSVGIYGTYEISILGRAIIGYVASAITWSRFTVTQAVIGSYLVSCSYIYNYNY